MKRVLLILILILVFGYCLEATTYEVALDGSQNWISISSAIDYATSGDTILVYPGHYMERLNTLGKDISIHSLYTIEPLQEYIDSTIIDGEYQLCLGLFEGETVVLDGFTISNCYNRELPGEEVFVSTVGGIWVSRSNLYLKNSKITNNCGTGTGGLHIAFGSSYLYTNNVIITNNNGNKTGGFSLYSAPYLNCNNLEVFDNFGALAMDFMVNATNGFDTLNLHFTKFSIDLDEPDYFFYNIFGVDINNDNYEDEFSHFNVSVGEGYFEQVDCDVYVSVNGSDDNSGASLSQPLKTISRALQLTKSNQARPNTIHIEAGIYSKEANNQKFPFTLKPNIKVLGAGIDETILDGEGTLIALGVMSSSNIEFGNITIRNGKYRASINPIHVINSKNLLFDDLEILSVKSRGGTGFLVGACNNVRFSNVIIGGNESHGQTVSTAYNMCAYLINYCHNISMSNIVIYGNKSYTDIHNHVGVFSQNSDLNARNVVITDCYGPDSTILAYYCTDSTSTDRYCKLENVLAYGNEVYTDAWTIKPFFLWHNNLEEIKVNVTNCTIANNFGNRPFFGIKGGYKLYNSIFYNPELTGFMGSIGLSNNPYNIPTTAYLYNCLIDYSDNFYLIEPDYVYSDNLIFDLNPQFKGEFDDSLGISDVKYYELAENSPCVDAGYSDTSFLPETDLVGNQRVWGDAVDIGAFEYGAPAVANTSEEIEAIKGSKISVYPNPINLSGKDNRSSCSIEFVIPKQTEKPVVSIYNIKGQKISSWKVNNSYQDMQKHAGLRKTNKGKQLYSTIWNMKNENNKPVASGLYIIRAEAEGYVATGKMIVIK
jgi:hypothetical protein